MPKVWKPTKAVKEIAIVFLPSPSERDAPRSSVSWRSVLMVTACAMIVTPALAASVYGYATGDFQPLKNFVQLMSDVLRFGLEWFKAAKQTP